MNEYQEMILQAEELDKQGKFAEADRLMQKTAFGLAEVMPAIQKYGPEVMKFVRKYGPQGVEVYQAWKARQQAKSPASAQPQLSAPANEVPGEFVTPNAQPQAQSSAPAMINSPLTPPQGNRQQHPVAGDFNKVVREFKQQLQKALTDLEYYKDIDEEKSQTAQDSRERSRASARMKAFDRLIQNINFNSKKAIEMAYNFMKYQVEPKQANSNSKKQVFAYTPRDLGALGITRKNTSLKGLAEGGSLEHWQQTFLKPIFDGFFQKVNDLATTHGQDPSKQINMKSKEQQGVAPVETSTQPEVQPQSEAQNQVKTEEPGAGSVVEAIHQGLQQAKGNDFTIRIHPDDMPVVKEAMWEIRSNLGPSAMLSYQVDESVPRGTCVIEDENGNRLGDQAEEPATQTERFPKGRNTGRWPDSADPYRDLIETPYAARPGKGY